jgi:hypothetical protein
MLIILLAIAAVVVATPLAAAALVTFASLREDAEHSLGGRPPGRLEAMSRRLLGTVSAAGQAPRARRSRPSGTPLGRQPGDWSGHEGTGPGTPFGGQPGTQPGLESGIWPGQADDEGPGLAGFLPLPRLSEDDHLAETTMSIPRP